MRREYYKWFSPNLQKDMELLAFGHSGQRILFFPTRAARFYDYENWHVIDALAPQIAAGLLQVFCVDSVDSESFYNNEISPESKLERHLQYEKYILDEVLDFSSKINPSTGLVSAGCSMGAYHAVNIAFKHPQKFVKVVAMSGRYDLTMPMGVFEDLLNGQNNEDIYFNMPTQYMGNLTDEKYLGWFRKLEITLAIGQDDIFLENNIFLSEILWNRNIANKLEIWPGEAHRAKYWQQMVAKYF